MDDVHSVQIKFQFPLNFVEFTLLKMGNTFCLLPKRIILDH